MDVSKLRRPGSFDAKTFKQGLRGAIRQGLSHLKDNEPSISAIVEKNKRAIKFGKFSNQKQKQAWQDLQKQSDESGVSITGTDEKVIKKIFKVLGSKAVAVNKDGSPQTRFKPEVMKRLQRGAQSTPYRDKVKSEGRLTRFDITNRANEVSGASVSDKHGLGGGGHDQLMNPGEASQGQYIRPGQSLSDHQAEQPFGQTGSSGPASLGKDAPGQVGSAKTSPVNRGPRPVSQDFLSR